MRCSLSRRALLGTLALPAAAAAQERGTLRIIVPFPPGGASDLIARAKKPSKQAMKPLENH